MLPSVQLALVPILVLLAGALGSLALGRRPGLATAWGLGSALLACGLGLVSSAVALVQGTASTWQVAPWPMPMGALLVGVDPLSAWFAAPVYLLGGLAAITGAADLRHMAPARNLGVAWFATLLFLAGMAGLLLARNGVLFLVAWELMSLSAFSLVTIEHERAAVRRAGWIYLVATHIGAAALFVLFLTLRDTSHGSTDFTVLHGGVAPTSLLLVLALVGFGAKAGLVPMHVWLPEAHAAAPSHVSALMSGVMVKLGVYGILRVVLVVGTPAWLGPVLLVGGLAGAGLGIGQALVQRDLKRILAFSTIENIGIVFVGLGAGLMARAAGRPDLAVLGIGGALLHTWVHAMMKGLLFLGAGSVLHATGTKDLEALGGLAQRMPVTVSLMTLGSVAIAALPPLGGFASEWLVYQGLLRGGQALPGAAGMALLLGVGGLAFVGALTATVFARLVGVALLGAPRSAAAAHAHESGLPTLLPMAVLALGCVLAGLVPRALLGLGAPVVAALAGGSALPATEALAPLGSMAALTWLLMAVAALVGRQLARQQPVLTGPTWDCGYAAPSPRMQYTGRAFAWLGEQLLPRALRARVRWVHPPRGAQPGPSRLAATMPEPVLERIFLPTFRGVADRSIRMRRLQHGRTHLYVAYIGVALILGLAWATLHTGGAS